VLSSTLYCHYHILIFQTMKPISNYRVGIMFTLHMCSSGFVGNKWTHLHSHGQFTLYMKIIFKCNKTIWWHCILRCIYWPQNMVHMQINVGHLTENNTVNRVSITPILQVTPQHLIFLSYWHKWWCTNNKSEVKLTISVLKLTGQLLFQYYGSKFT